MRGWEKGPGEARHAGLESHGHLVSPEPSSATPGHLHSAARAVQMAILPICLPEGEGKSWLGNAPLEANVFRPWRGDIRPAHQPASTRAAEARTKPEALHSSVPVSTREPLVKEPVYRGWPQHALTACAGFVGVVGLNEAVSSNVPGRSDIHRSGIVRAVWHFSTAKRARPWIAGAGDSQRR